MSGKIDANGNFNGTYLTLDGSRFPISGTFSNGHAHLAKQPVIPNSQSGVNITFDLTLTGVNSSDQTVNTSPGPVSSSTDQLTSFFNNINPATMVAGVAALLVVIGLVSAASRRMATNRATGKQTNRTIGKHNWSTKGPSVIHQRGPTYSEPAPYVYSDPPNMIGLQDAAGGIVVSGAGAYVMPVNQGRLNVQSEVRKVGVGAPWGNGVIDQLDSNYALQIRANWATDYAWKTYPDHFLVTFTNPAPPGAYFDWIIVK